MVRVVTVYVDDMKAPFGRMVMCHCWADTREELFAMMDRIGVQRKWFQQPPKASWEHFDIAMTKRALAVQFGAVEVCQFTMAEHANRQNFLAACAVQNWQAAKRALHFMCLAHNTRERRS